MPHNHEWKLECNFEGFDEVTVSAYCNNCNETMTDAEICAIQNTSKPDDVFVATEDDGSQWVAFEDYISALRSKSHIGDPCKFCGMAHDDVAIGDCPNRNMKLI